MTVKPSDVLVLSPAKLELQITMPDSSMIKFQGDIPADAEQGHKAMIAVADAIHTNLVDAGWFVGGVRP
jgi:hypothetical protein